jgi:hypothetical protein
VTEDEPPFEDYWAENWPEPRPKDERGFYFILALLELTRAQTVRVRDQAAELLALLAESERAIPAQAFQAVRDAAEERLTGAFPGGRANVYIVHVRPYETDTLEAIYDDRAWVLNRMRLLADDQDGRIAALWQQAMDGWDLLRFTAPPKT